MKKTLSYDEALSKAQRLCSREERCPFDVRQKLYQWGLPQDEHQALIDELIQDKFLDDYRYAKAFTADKWRFNKWGRLKIRYALQQKQVATSAINEALAAIPPNDYKAMLEQELQKKFNALKADTLHKQKAALLRFAHSRGYESEAIQILIDDFFSADH